MLNNILIVDDDEISNKINCILLLKMKISRKVVCKTDGIEAIDFIEKKAVPDVIFLDTQMPGMDGIDFLKQLQLIDRIKNIKVIVITAHLVDVVKKEFEALGIMDFITKPLTQEKCLKIFDKLYSNKGSCGLS